MGTPDAAPVTPERPPICMRQELSVAVQTWAWVSRTHATLSASIATDTSAFFSAKVPPKPQHSSLCGSSMSRSPWTASSRRVGRSWSRNDRSEWQEVCNVTEYGKVAPTSVTPSVSTSSSVNSWIRGSTSATCVRSAASPVSVAILGY